jgi:hypothetical protein
MAEHIGVIHCWEVRIRINLIYLVTTTLLVQSSEPTVRKERVGFWIIGFWAIFTRQANDFAGPIGFLPSPPPPPRIRLYGDEEENKQAKEVEG